MAVQASPLDIQTFSVLAPSLTWGVAPVALRQALVTSTLSPASSARQKEHVKMLDTQHAALRDVTLAHAIVMQPATVLVTVAMTTLLSYVRREVEELVSV